MRKAILFSLLLTSFAVSAQVPNVELIVTAPVALSESNQGTWIVRITNHNTTPTGDLTLTFQHFARYPLSGQVSLPPACAPDRFGNVECVVNVPPVAAVELPFVVQYDRRFGYATFTAYLSSRAATAAFLFSHEYPVTTVADSGPGSLRQAILDINRDCSRHLEPCAPVFRIDGPVPEEGWFTIRPLSPLPEITAVSTVLDGKTQSRHTGETNGVQGAEVMLDGSSAGPAHGLWFKGYEAQVSNLAIGNFDGNGIESNSSLAVNAVSVGLHPSGFRAAPNAGRGIQVNGGTVSIADSFLCANGRAGAYLTGSQVSVRGSFIGVAADGVTPLGNGASGLFFQKQGMHWEEHGAWDNVIANNGHAGIGFTTQVIGDFGRNTFRNNGGRAIDVEMNGASLEPRIGHPGLGGIIGAPVIESARYENGVTTITGYVREHTGSIIREERVYLYANRAARDGGDLIATIVPEVESAPEPRTRRFTARLERDLRDLYVSASHFMHLLYNFDDPAPGTSEVSEPRLVR
jgi:hypothetical protein